MKSEPRIEDRPEQPYAGIRTVMPMSAFDRAIPEMIAEVSKWLDANGERQSGKPFLRYHVIDMPERMDVELGIPTKGSVDGTGRVARGALPAGRYAVLAYKGIKNALAANKELIDWIDKHGEEAISRQAENGEAFESRYETFLTDASREPDQEQWTEIAIKLRG